MAILVPILVLKFTHIYGLIPKIKVLVKNLRETLLMP